jgi:protein-tyrosine phosphatase
MGKDAEAVVGRAVDALAAGQIVAFPTETVYGLAASVLLPDAVERLAMAKGRPDDKPMTLALAGAEHLREWVPDLSPTAWRLAQRSWPGPVTIVVNANGEGGLASRLADSVRKRVCPTGSLGFRVADHAALTHVLYNLAGPLALTSANRAGAVEALTAGEVCDAVGEQVALVIDGGPSRLGKPSTVVRVDKDQWTVLREGAVPLAELAWRTCRIIVFVCTGNTCRSPLAEALCKKCLAERLNCTPADLPRHGFVVLSAGLAAMMGDAATLEAAAVGQELGVDLTSHSSRPLTAELANAADCLVTMTQGHQVVLQTRFPRTACRPRLLTADGSDIPDPIGGDEHVYRECAQEIMRQVERLLPELQQS